VFLCERIFFMTGQKSRIDIPHKREGTCTWEYWDYTKQKNVKCKRKKTGWFFCDEHKKLASEIESGSFISRSIKVTRDDG